MTDNYVKSAIDRMVEMQAEITNNSVNSLRIITSVGVIAGIFGYLSKDTLPVFTYRGGVFFLIIIILTWLLNEGITYYYFKKNYKLRKETSFY
jgi:hypothetical protein